MRSLLTNARRGNNCAWHQANETYVSSFQQSTQRLLSDSARHGDDETVSSSTSRTTLVSLVSDSISRSSAIFLTYCIPCHQVNPKGEMKGSAIAGPVAKECAGECRLLFHLGQCSTSDAIVNQIYGPELRATPVPSSEKLLWTVCARAFLR